MSADHVAVHPDRPRVAVPCGAALGEGPIWDGRIATLFWVDIKAGLVWMRPDGGEPRSIEVGEEVGFVRSTDDPNVLLLGLRSGLALMDLAAGTYGAPFLRPEPDLPGNRLNDADVAPDGTLLFGSMHDGETEPTGRFHHLRASGLETFGSRAIVTNGPAVDPALGRVYAADTTGGRIFRHDLRDDGALGPAAPFVSFGEGDGHPDGLTVDGENHLWVCHFGAGRITRFTPEGVPVLVVPMPTPRVTKIAFGGPDLTAIYATTASIGLDRETDPLAGHLFVFEAGIRGLPARPWRRLMELEAHTG